MLENKLSYLNSLDTTAKTLAIDFTNGKLITSRILQTIIELYRVAKVEQEFKNEYFETAYHSPITSELEFFIARILFHFSKENNKGWKILLRRQEGKTAPDIRLLKDNKTFAVIEIKAKAGWIQWFFSPERYANDRQKFEQGKSKYDIDALIQNARNQLTKYYDQFGLTNNDVYLFLPTLALVHRKKYKTDLAGYYKHFVFTSNLPVENFILLSKNKELDLSKGIGELEPTDNFERLITKLSEK